MHRVQKILAEAGIGSRRYCEELIAQGRVSVNGKTISLGATASDNDEIFLDGKMISKEKKTYILLYKPIGVVSTTDDPLGRETVLDIVPLRQRLYPVGRLDIDAEGLMLLTNDGDYANKMMHPRYGVRKTYEVWLNNKIEKTDVEKLRRGIMIEKRMVVPDSVMMKKINVVEIVIHEGQKHVVKRLFKKLGYGVKRLIRTQLGPWKLNNLLPGKYLIVNPKTG